MKRVFLSLLPVFCLLLLVGAFFYQTVFRGNVPVPTDALIGLYHPWRDLYAATNPRGVPYKNFLITDPFRQQIPWKKEVIDQWKQGKIPVWDPHAFSGAPLIANIQAAVWYPLNGLFFILPFLSAWSLYIMAQLLLASLFCYLYLRSLELSPVASFVGALLWTFSGFSIAWLTWGTIMQTAAWIPLGLAAIEMMRKEKQTKAQMNWWTVALVVALVCQLVAGHAQVALYGWLVTSIYMLWRGLWWRHVIALIIAVCITAVVWVPLGSFFLTTGRSITPVWQKEGWFLPWEHLVQFLVPDFFGNPATLNYWGKWNYGEFLGFVGSAGIFFAMLGSMFSRTLHRTFYLAMLVIVLLFLLPTPVASLPYILQLPLFSSLQPTRLIVLVDFALVILAAYGVEWWWTNPPRKQLWPIIVGLSFIYMVLWGGVFVATHLWPAGAAWLAISKRNLVLPTLAFVGIAASVGLAFFYAKTKYIKTLCLVVIVGISVVELFRLGWKFTPFTPSSYFFPETGVIRFLTKQKKPFRVLSLDERILPPNTSAYYDIENAEGYDPLFSKRYQEFMGTLQTGDPKTGRVYDFNRIVTVKNLDSLLFEVLGVAYVLSIDPPKGSAFEKVYEEGATKVYRYQHALPRAFFVSRVVVVPTEHVLAEMLKPSFVAYADAVVEQNVHVENASFSLKETAVIQTYDKGAMTIGTQTEQKRFLVITQAYSPYMHVAIDGVPTSVYPTDYIFSGIVVPQGKHTIVVRYSL